MINTIPLSRDKRLNTSSERIFLGILWILTKQNTQEGFFLKDDINLFGGIQTYNRISKKLSEQNIISFTVKGIGLTKHRYFTIIDPEIIKEFKNTSKTLTEQKRSKSGTDIPPTDQNSILCNPDSNLREFFDVAMEQITQEGKMIPLSLNLTLEIFNFKEFYKGKKVSVDTVYKWLLKAI